MATDGLDPEAAFLMQMKAQHESDAAEINENDSGTNAHHFDDKQGQNDQNQPSLVPAPDDHPTPQVEPAQEGEAEEQKEGEEKDAGAGTDSYGENRDIQEEEGGGDPSNENDIEFDISTPQPLSPPRKSASPVPHDEYDPMSAIMDNAVLHTAGSPASTPKSDGLREEMEEEEDQDRERDQEQDQEQDQNLMVDAAEYDPESASGPFVIDEDDVEDSANVPGGGSPNGVEEAGRESMSPPVMRSPTNDAVENLPAPNVPVALASSVESKSPRPENIQSPAAESSSAKPAAVSGNAMAGGHGKRKRLPQDIIGQLEDRIAEDPRGDMDAWLSLMTEHQKKGKMDETRATFERFLKVFPTAAEQWVAYCQFELNANDFYRVEQLFNRCLLAVSNVELWTLYLGYIRRRNNLSTDASGKARSVVSQSYEFVLNNIGIDRESGKLWQDYVNFIKSGPGNIGGSGWQDQQKMDHLRKVYQRVICIPVTGVEGLWKEYDSFEMGLNKITGRKFLQEKSPSYMTARSSLSELRNLTQGLNRASLPRLRPAPGFDGHEDYMQQVELWNRWIAWEKGDPLVLEQEDPAAFQKRIIYVYKQALMALRFWPEMWFEASSYCFSIKKDKEAVDFLKQGLAANPESCLLSFRYAEHLESSVPAPPTEDKEAVKRRSAPVRQVYDDLLDVYYSIVAKIQTKETVSIANIEASNVVFPRPDGGDDDDDDEDTALAKSKESQIAMLKESTKAELFFVQKTISAIWINLMRAMRRLEGHGKVGDIVGGSRQIFADARKKGKITSDVYVASALIEYHCYKDPSASRIFDRGMKIFSEEEEFHLEYLKFLISTNDITNARSVFETFVGKFPPEKADQARRVYYFFYEYESQYGELHQIKKLESRLKELFPNDPQLKLFSQRYTYKVIDPSSFSPVVSATQIRPKQQLKVLKPALPLPERSPKRFAEDSDSEFPNKNERPRKIHRGESPLKGAAGRRLDQQKRARANEAARSEHRSDGFKDGFKDRNRDYQPKESGPGGFYQAPPPPPPPPPPAPLPDAIMLLLSILPPARSYTAARFNAEAMVKLLQNTNIPSQPAMQQNGLSQNSLASSFNYQQKNIFQMLEESTRDLSQKQRQQQPRQPHQQQHYSGFQRPQQRAPIVTTSSGPPFFFPGGGGALQPWFPFPNYHNVT